MINPTLQVPENWFRDSEYCAQLGRRPVGLRKLDTLVQRPDTQAKADEQSNEPQGNQSAN